MKLYVTLTSPYARIARAVVIEKGLADRVEVVEAVTRKPDSSYYGINPSGRVPYLQREGTPGLEDSRLIAAYLDALDGKPSIALPLAFENWAYGRLESYAQSMVDGISVWVREMRRAESERSPATLAHEVARAARLADFWEAEIANPLMNGPINLAQIALFVAIDLAAYRGLGDLTERRPRLQSWTERMRQRPSLAATAPPPA